MRAWMMATVFIAIASHVSAVPRESARPRLSAEDLRQMRAAAGRSRGG